MAQIQRRVKKLQAERQKVTVHSLKTHYNLSCSAQTIIDRVLKPLGQKWLRRSHKPGVPADRPARGSVSGIHGQVGVPAGLSHSAVP